MPIAYCLSAAGHTINLLSIVPREREELRWRCRAAGGRRRGGAWGGSKKAGKPKIFVDDIILASTFVIGHLSPSSPSSWRW